MLDCMSAGILCVPVCSYLLHEFVSVLPSYLKQVSLGTAASPHRKSECTGTSHDSCHGHGQNIKNYYWGGGALNFISLHYIVCVLPLS